MADFNSSLPVRTENPGDVVVEVSVGGTPIDPRDVRPLTSADVVTAAQGAPNTAANGWPVKPTDGTNSQQFTAAGEAKVSVTQPLPAGTNLVGSVNARLLDEAGNPFTTVNPLPVEVAVAAGTEVNDFNTGTNIAANGTSNHDYAVTASTTFKGKKFWASASGKMKVTVQVSPDGTNFNTKFVGFTSTSNPNLDITLGDATLSNAGTGAIVRIIRQNLDKAAMDVYSTISGTES